jgi:outer membrane lipoprotein-sorting protein
MTDEWDEDRDLGARLEEAGQWCQPRHPGWQTLRDRLGQQVTGTVPSDRSQLFIIRTLGAMIRPLYITRSGDGTNWIMRHLVSAVTAASIFVLAVSGVALWFHGGATPAFADFLQPILEAKTVKFKVTMEIKGPPPVTTTGEMMFLDAARTRIETETPDKSKRVEILDCSQGKQLILMIDTKTATVVTCAPREGTSANGDPFGGFRSLFLNARDKSDLKREPLGEKDIDGRRVVGFQVTIRGVPVNLWGDPKTGQPVRMEITVGMDGNMKVTASDFVFNADMDESLFNVEPPAGYTVRCGKSDATPREEKALIAMFREYSRLTTGRRYGTSLIDGPMPSSSGIVQLRVRGR